MDVVPNEEWGVKYTNLELYIILSQYLGAPLVSAKIPVCKKCNKCIDNYGWHSLHCSFGINVIERHNKLKMEMAKLFKEADYKIKIEQKYDMEKIMEMIQMERKWMLKNIEMQYW